MTQVILHCSKHTKEEKMEKCFARTISVCKVFSPNKAWGNKSLKLIKTHVSQFKAKEVMVYKDC